MARYYIADTFNGVYIKTDDEKTALNYATSEDYFVLDTKDDKWITVDGPVDIPETAKVSDDDD